MIYPSQAPREGFFVLYHIHRPDPTHPRVHITSSMADTETPISPVTGNKPELTVSAASVDVNPQEPVELDSTPASPEQVLAMRRGSKGDGLTQLSAEERQVCFWIRAMIIPPLITVCRNGRSLWPSARAIQQFWYVFTWGMRLWRPQHLPNMPCAKVDVPQTPNSEEFGKSESAEGKVSK